MYISAVFLPFTLKGSTAILDKNVCSYSRYLTLDEINSSCSRENGVQ